MRGGQRLRPDRPGEAGFAVVEVMASAVLLIVLAIATFSMLDQSSRHSGTSRSRSVATGLAQADQETIRQLPMTQLAGGYDATQTKTVGGVPYQVVSTARWARDATGEVTCTSGSAHVAYLKTKSTVTWPNMAVDPVVIEGIVAPGVKALGGTSGSLMVMLTRANGSGTSGITVSAGGVSATTDNQGCAVLGNVPAGTQTLTFSQGGYVNDDGVGSVSTSVSIAAQSMAQYQDLYDAAGQVDVAMADDQGTPVSWPTVTLEHSQRSSGDLEISRPTPTAAVVSAPNLFPFTSPYNAYVGGCNGNDPTSYLSSYSASSVLVTPSVTKTVAGPLRRVTVTVRDSTNALLTTAGIAVYPETTDSKMAGCTEGVSRQLVSSANGQYTITLPFGVWRICADTTSGTRRARALTVVGGSGNDDPIVNTPAGTTGAYAPKLSTTLKTPSTTTGGSLCP